MARKGKKIKNPLSLYGKRKKGNITRGYCSFKNSTYVKLQECTIEEMTKRPNDRITICDIINRYVELGLIAEEEKAEREEMMEEIQELGEENRHCLDDECLDLLSPENFDEVELVKKLIESREEGLSWKKESREYKRLMKKIIRISGDGVRKHCPEKILEYYDYIQSRI